MISVERNGLPGGVVHVKTTPATGPHRAGAHERGLYDPRLGRFLSPDPVVADATMSQDWNAYSYASNSPMSYADPTGYVRAGPGCDSITVFCAANDTGGGTRSSRSRIRFPGASG